MNETYKEIAKLNRNDLPGALRIIASARQRGELDGDVMHLLLMLQDIHDDATIEALDNAAAGAL